MSLKISKKYTWRSKMKSPRRFMTTLLQNDWEGNSFSKLTSLVRTSSNLIFSFSSMTQLRIRSTVLRANKRRPFLCKNLTIATMLLNFLTASSFRNQDWRELTDCLLPIYNFNNFIRLNPDCTKVTAFQPLQEYMIGVEHESRNLRLGFKQ